MTEMRASVHDFPIDECRLFEGTKCTNCKECEKKMTNDFNNTENDSTKSRNENRFERIYEDVDVFCRDHNAKGLSQLIERDDYDKIVDLLNELNNENTHIKTTIKNMMESERTTLGKSVLKQLWEAIE